MAGALLLAVRNIEDSAIQRRIGLAMISAHILGGLVVWAQHIAIWNSPAGAVLAGWLTLMPVVWFFLVRPRAANQVA